MDILKEIISRGEGLEMIEQLKGIKSALIARGSNDASKMTMGDVQTAVRLGSLGLFSPGDEFTFSTNPTISTFQGTLIDSGTAGVTGATVTSATFISKVGTASGMTVLFVYDGSNWRLDSLTGTVVSLADYGVVVAGTAKTSDYVSVSEATSSEVFQVANRDSTNKVMTLMAKNCIEDGQQFETPPELAFANTLLAIPAGKYKITTKTAGDDDLVADGTYVFTTTVAIPVGGGFWIDAIGSYYGSGTKADHVPTTVKTYAADHSTILETLTLTAYNSSTDSAAVDMGTYTREYDSTVTYNNTYGYSNFARRVAYGSNDYATSIIRQWLNTSSLGGGWWKAKSIFKLKPSNGWTDDRAGYMYGFDTDAIGALKKSKRSYYMYDGDYSLMTALGLTKPVQYIDDPNVTVSGHIVTVEDYFYLASIVEVGLGNQWSDNLAGNTVFELFDGSADSDRIKRFGTTAKYCWLRSPTPWNCGHAAGVSPTGTLDSNRATGGLAVVPACDIG